MCALCTLSVDHSPVHYPCHDAVVWVVHLERDALQEFNTQTHSVHGDSATGSSVTSGYRHETLPSARLCSSGTGPDGLWWRSPVPCLRWCSLGSLRSGRGRWVEGSPSEPRHCKPRGRPRRAPATRPVVTRADTELEWGNKGFLNPAKLDCW